MAANRLSASQLRQRLERALDRRKYQEALRLGKELVKREETPEHLDLLSRAYQGRIRGLAGQGLFKEANGLLGTMGERCGRGLEYERLRLVVAVRAASWHDAVSAYADCLPDLTGEERLKLEALFGAALLAGNQVPVDLFPEESLVATHLPLAEAALDAFCGGHADEARTALKKIPFRSPYRDFRLLLNGCLLLAENPLEADRFFLKIPADSPYASAAACCRCRTYGAREVLKCFQEGTAGEQRLLARVFHLQAAETRFLSALPEAARDGYRFYQLVSKDGRCLSGTVRQRVLKRLLPHCSAKIVDLLQKYHRSMEPAEMQRLAALAAELDGAWEAAVEFWGEYLEILAPEDPLYGLKSALVLRHTAELLQTEGELFFGPERLEVLEESLRHDPEDADTWLEVIRLASRVDSLKRAYRLANEALEVLPEDPRILLAVMEAAVNRRAFKKAAALAGRVLAIDPINSRAKNLLLVSHLGHGRKLTRQGKFELARREFEAADMDVRSLRYRGRGLICLGMLCLLEGLETEGHRWVERGRAFNGSPLFSGLLALLEAHLFGVESSLIKNITAELRELVKGEPVREDVLRLADWMWTLAGEEWLAFEKFARVLKGYLSRAAAEQWDLDDGLLLCRALHRGGFLVALGKVAEPLHRRWPGHSEIHAYELLSRARNNGRMLRPEDAWEFLVLSREFKKAGKHELAKDLSRGYRLASEKVGTRMPEESREIFELPRSLFLEEMDEDDDDDDPFFPEQLDLF